MLPGFTGVAIQVSLGVATCFQVLLGTHLVGDQLPVVSAKCSQQMWQTLMTVDLCTTVCGHITSNTLVFRPQVHWSHYIDQVLRKTIYLLLALTISLSVAPDNCG